MEKQHTDGAERRRGDGEMKPNDARDPATTLSADGRATAAQMDRRPNWNRWAHVAQARVYEAVALSLDIDPDKVDWGKGAKVGSAPYESKEFGDRLFVAVRNVEIGETLSIVSSPGQSSVIDARIVLSEFVAWATKLRWRLPAALVTIFGDNDPDYVPPHDSYWDFDPAIRSAASRWPWGDHETILLRHLAAAAKKFWSLYDPADPTTAPTNETVTEWLTTEGVARRTAEAMATILRADSLPVGRRKE